MIILGLIILVIILIFYKYNSLNKLNIIKFIVFYISILALGFFSKYYFKNVILKNNIFHSLKFDISDIVLLVGFIISLILIFFYKFAYFSKSKQIKHGALFKSTTKSKNGILIGKFDKNIIPSYIRQFCKSNSGENIVIPYEDLSKTVCIIGDMGSGKSRVMEIIEDNIKNQYPDIPILIHDPKGEWLRTYYNPESDLIFAPFDKRSFSWDVCNDFTKYPYLRHSVISTAIESHQSGSGDKFWSDSATELLKEIFFLDSIDEMKAKLLSLKQNNSDDKTFMSTFSIAKMALRDLATIILSQTNKKLSLNDLLNHKGRIFLLNNPAFSKEQHSSLTLLLTAFFMQVISLPDIEAGKLRAAVIMDEALTFKLPVEVERAIFTQCRSKGLSIITSAQRIPQPQKNENSAWANNAGHIIAMRCSNLETRKIFSQRAGEIKYTETQQSTNYAEKGTKSNTIAEHHEKHAILAPEDFGNLKNREMILFHNDGIALGKSLDFYNTQSNIDVSIYNERKDVVEFMEHL